MHNAKIPGVTVLLEEQAYGAPKCPIDVTRIGKLYSSGGCTQELLVFMFVKKGSPPSGVIDVPVCNGTSVVLSPRVCKSTLWVTTYVCRTLV